MELPQEPPEQEPWPTNTVAMPISTAGARCWAIADSKKTTAFSNARAPIACPTAVAVVARMNIETRISDPAVVM